MLSFAIVAGWMLGLPPHTLEAIGMAPSGMAAHLRSAPQCIPAGLYGPHNGGSGRRGGRH